MDEMIKNAINDWETIVDYSHATLNRYADLYESLFITVGLFIRGLRCKAVKTDDLQFSYHYTLDGFRGILCMNVDILKRKIKLV
jgi:hypothetical protein